MGEMPAAILLAQLKKHEQLIIDMRKNFQGIINEVNKSEVLIGDNGVGKFCFRL